MYTAFLVIHSFMRWIVVLAGALAVARAIGGVTGRRAWTPPDERAGRWFGIGLDIQLLVGAVLYLVLSPFTMDAWSDVAATMRNAPLRFIAVEHVTGMLIALVLAHVGRSRIRKAAEPARRHKLAAIFYTLALIVILFSTPWPWSAGGRPYIRGFSSEQP